MKFLKRKEIAKRIPCLSSEQGDNELEISGDDILVDGLIKKGKGENQLEVAIGDGMEFTIHGDLKNKGKKNKLMNNTNVSDGDEENINLFYCFVIFQNSVIITFRT